MTIERNDQLSPEDQGLKSATRALVRAFGGQGYVAMRLADGAKQFARQQRVSDCCLPNVNDFLSIQATAILEDETHGHAGHPHITRALARRQGFALVPVRVDPPQSGDWLRLIGDLSELAGGVVAGISGALASDSTVCAADARAADLRQRAEDLMTIAGELMGAVNELEGR